MERISQRISRLSPKEREVLSGRIRAKLLSLTSAHSQLVALNAGGKRPPFFCVHPSGGDVLCYSRLANCLGPEQPVYGIRALGLEEGEQPLSTIEALAERYVNCVLQVQPDGPYFLGGYSMGAIAAFEMARQLKTAGMEVKLLALLDMWVLSPDEITEIDDALVLSGFLGGYLPVEFLRNLPQNEQVPYVCQRLKELGWLDKDVTVAQIQRIVRVCKMNDLAVQAFKPSSYPGKITLFRAQQERDAARGSRPRTQERSLGWSRFAEVDVHDVPGNHDNLMMSPHVEELANVLRGCFELTGARVRT